MRTEARRKDTTSPEAHSISVPCCVCPPESASNPSPTGEEVIQSWGGACRSRSVSSVRRKKSGLPPRRGSSSEAKLAGTLLSGFQCLSCACRPSCGVLHSNPNRLRHPRHSSSTALGPPHTLAGHSCGSTSDSRVCALGPPVLFAALPPAPRTVPDTP